MTCKRYEAGSVLAGELCRNRISFKCLSLRLGRRRQGHLQSQDRTELSPLAQQPVLRCLELKYLKSTSVSVLSIKLDMAHRHGHMEVELWLETVAAQRSG
jgi:hypothetical protein